MWNFVDHGNILGPMTLWLRKLNHRSYCSDLLEVTFDFFQSYLHLSGIDDNKGVFLKFWNLLFLVDNSLIEKPAHFAVEVFHSQKNGPTVLQAFIGTTWKRGS